MDLLRFYYTQNPTPMEDEDLFDAYEPSFFRYFYFHFSMLIRHHSGWYNKHRQPNVQ